MLLIFNSLPIHSLVTWSMRVFLVGDSGNLISENENFLTAVNFTYTGTVHFMALNLPWVGLIVNRHNSHDKIIDLNACDLLSM